MQSHSHPTRRQLRAAEGRRPARDRATAPAIGHRPAPRRRHPSHRRRVFGLAAMTFAALLTVSVSVPALAVNPSTPVTWQAAASPGRPQTLAMSANGVIVVQRDGFTIGQIPKPKPKPQPAAVGNFRTAGTYVNYPDSPIQWPFPVGVPISTYFGPREAPCAGCSTFHKGLDMNPGVNTPIQAMADGVVRELSPTDNGGLGVYVIVDHMIGGRLVSSLYAHMAEGSLTVAVGQPVLVGQQIGNVGNTGQSTGPHLHFEVLLDGQSPTDPFAWLTERVRSP